MKNKIATRGTLALLALTALLLAVFLLPPLDAQAFLDHWNSGTGGKPSRNGLTWERGPTNTMLQWQGGLYSVIGLAPSMEGDIVVMTRLNPATWNTPDVQKGGIMVAHDLTTGQVLWTNALPIDFPETDWFSDVIAIRDKRVFATRSSGNGNSFLYALDAQTGKVAWRCQDTIKLYSESPSFAPNGDLIVGSFNRILRINATNGACVWSTPRTTPASGSSEPAVFGNHVYIWEQSGFGPKVSTFDLESGAFRCSSPGLGGVVQQMGLFAGPDGIIYAPRAEGNGTTNYLVAFRDSGVALVEKWRVPLAFVNFASFGVGPDGSVYSYSPDYRVIRIRPQDGVVIGSSQILQPELYSPRMAIDSTGILFVSNGGSTQSALFSLNPDLTLRWTEPIPHLNSGGPAIGKNGVLVIAGTGTDVRAYRGSSYGLPGPPLQLSRDGDGLIITYSGALESADDPTGPWAEVRGAASPWKVTPTRASEFFRSRQ